MPTATKPKKAGRPPMPAALRRDEWIRVRVSGLEKQAAEARAAAAGCADLSEYGRLQMCGAAPGQVAARVAEIQRSAQAERRAPGDREAIMQRIRREQPGLPESSVKILAGRELARG